MHIFFSILLWIFGATGPHAMANPMTFTPVLSSQQQAQPDMSADDLFSKQLGKTRLRHTIIAIDDTHFRPRKKR